jgi:hypothetical protein
MAMKLKGLEVEGRDSNGGMLNVGSESTLFLPPTMYAQVIPRVPMLIGVGPLNRMLVVVWYVITMVTINLKYLSLIYAVTKLAQKLIINSTWSYQLVPVFLMTIRPSVMTA